MDITVPGIIIGLLGACSAYFGIGVLLSIWREDGEGVSGYGVCFILALGFSGLLMR